MINVAREVGALKERVEAGLVDGLERIIC